MADKNDPKTDTSKRIQRTEAYAEKVRKMFAETVNDILAINKSIPELDEGEMYSFDGAGARMQREVEQLLRRLNSAVILSIRQGITLEWEQANIECDKLVASVFGKEALSNPKFNAITGRNEAAMNAFINRSENGLYLSDRIWKSVQQLREEMEVAMTVAIGEGLSASQMSRKVREYLNDPDLMFRRFRYKNENGEWKRKWKKRVKDEETGKYKWIDYDKDDYKTDTGVYKSSAKNAMRVTRTETNIAYRRADHERWQQMDFVLGQRIELSRNHPKKDICDALQGEYPTEFVFDGWHPQCFCFAVPILVDEDEMVKVNEAFLKGKTYTPKGKKITDYPQEFKDWVKDNADNIKASREKGTEPYFIRNNAAAVDDILNPKPKELTTLEKAQIRHEARTPEQTEAIRNRWAERQKKHALIRKTAANVLKTASDYGEANYSRLQQYIADGNLSAMQTEAKAVAKQVSAIKDNKAVVDGIIRIENNRKEYERLKADPAYTDVEFDPKSGGLKATHKMHNFDKDKGWYELKIQDMGFRNGHAVILEKEKGKGIGENYTEGTWDDFLFELASCETGTSNNLVKGLKHCASKTDTEVAVIFLPYTQYNESEFTRALSRYEGMIENNMPFKKFKRVICLTNEGIMYDKTR